MTNKIGPNDLGKHPDVIKRAQQELLKMDILVCGGCHATFHFVLGFEEHKENCKGAQNKQKPDLGQNWAFLLWKSAQANSASMNSWKLYQSWAQLDSKQQAAWVTAGQTIQTISRIGHGSVQETQVKVMRTVTGPVKSEPGLMTPKAEADTDVDTGKNKAEKNPYQKVDNSTNPPTLINRYMVKRTMNSSATHIEVRECLAEKVTSRRLNGKRNTYEYFVKWSDFESTWEPKSHFDKGLELITECERKLAKQKSGAAAVAPAAAAAAVATPIRPERTSKARAVSTLKTWCNTGDPSAGQQAGGDLKRKNTDSDYAEAEDSSQDESFGVGSPSPSKQIKTSPLVTQRTSGGQLRYYQKPVNGGLAVVPSSIHSAEVVIDKLGEKASGVRRKPGVVAPVKREAQVKVVGRNETTSSGIVRVGKASASLPTPPLSPLSPAAAANTPRMQKVVQTTRTAAGTTLKRTVYRTMPTTPGSSPAATPSPVLARTGAVAARPAAGAMLSRPATHTYQVNKQGVTRTPQAAAAAASPAAKSYQVCPNRIMRTPVAKPLKAASSPAAGIGRVVRSSPSAVSPVTKPVTRAAPVQASPTANSAAMSSSPSADSDEMTLCPVTGKLITKAEADAQAAAGEDADSELQRLLTSAEEEAAAAMAGSGSTGTDTQIHELIQNEDGSPVMITGDDGTVYQVAGKNAEGQTLLITQGEEGEQQCVIMASPEEAAGESAHSGSTGEGGEEGMMAVDGDSQDGQITAELVQADEPSADGTRRVVLLLPDGNLMVSELNEEQYQQFNLGG